MMHRHLCTRPFLSVLLQESLADLRSSGYPEVFYINVNILKGDGACLLKITPKPLLCIYITIVLFIQRPSSVNYPMGL